MGMPQWPRKVARARSQEVDIVRIEPKFMQVLAEVTGERPGKTAFVGVGIIPGECKEFDRNTGADRASRDDRGIETTRDAHGEPAILVGHA
jgi:hypothetical protein